MPQNTGYSGSVMKTVLAGVFFVLILNSILALLPDNKIAEKATTTTKIENRPTIGNEGAKNLVSADDDPFKGEANASVTMVEFGNYNCVFCAKFNKEILPQLQEKYIDTGKVRFVFRDFPSTKYKYSFKAAEASECADEQGKFWEYHDMLFENTTNMTPQRFAEIGKELSLNATQFDDCLNSGEKSREVQKDVQDGLSYAVDGAPTFFVNGKILEGPQPYHVFEKVIEDGLK